MPEPRRYKLTQTVIDSWYTRDGRFRFRIGFDRWVGTTRTIYPAHACGIIEISDTDVVQTTNEMAQTCLASYLIPQGMKWNGLPPPSGPVFEDVTDKIPHSNVDLDPYFNG